MIKENRLDKRLTISLSINYKTLEISEKKCANTISKDISENGVRIILEKFYPPKTKFLIKVDLKNRAIEGIAESIWSFNSQYSNRYYNGLRFTDMNKQDREILKEYTTLKNLTI